ncbi:hypothetical protein SLS58_006184 [Diplodia intermedia]|uniref:SGNH hydrolase-type esterase domain-containing protein n=1 Tax=Diplodia intermedia TaxID=856260 RepID=A0ABR3TP28_9PEZI
MKLDTSPSSLAWTAFSAAAAVAALPPGDGRNVARVAAATTPTVYLAGDSTMAEQGGKNGTEGWGHYLQYSLSIPVVNKAFAGRSARSFTDQGRFAAIEAAVVPGDFVVIEFGHNDGGGSNLGTANYTDNGRPACPGQGNETCVSFYNGTEVVVHTYNWYMLHAARSFLAKGASVVISTMTPTNPWETGNFSYTPPIYVGYAEHVEGVLEGEVGEEAAFVNHGKYEAHAFEELGKEVVDGFFLMDHTHTQPEGADVAAKAFVKGLKCGGSELSGFVVNATEEIPGVCL